MPVDAALSSAGRARLRGRPSRFHAARPWSARPRPTSCSSTLAATIRWRAISLARSALAPPNREGLASVESGVDTLISFSTQPGNVALDGAGRNSPYSGPLVKTIGTPGRGHSFDAYSGEERGHGRDGQQTGALGYQRAAGEVLFQSGNPHSFAATSAAGRGRAGLGRDQGDAGHRGAGSVPQAIWRFERALRYACTPAHRGGQSAHRRAGCRRGRQRGGKAGRRQSPDETPAVASEQIGRLNAVFTNSITIPGRKTVRSPKIPKTPFSNIRRRRVSRRMAC